MSRLHPLPGFSSWLLNPAVGSRTQDRRRPPERRQARGFSFRLLNEQSARDSRSLTELLLEVVELCERLLVQAGPVDRGRLLGVEDLLQGHPSAQDGRRLGRGRVVIVIQPWISSSSASG